MRHAAWRAACAVVSCAALMGSAPSPAQDKTQVKTPDHPYIVVDGYKVDPDTMNGFRAWRAAACDRCHGANQQGLVGPSLIDSLKTLSKEDFKKTVTEGRLEKGMVSFKTSTTVMENLDNLYAYLKGRSNGDITRAKVEEIKP
jgi:mono/diheme cytochrome c family protein